MEDFLKEGIDIQSQMTYCGGEDFEGSFENDFSSDSPRSSHRTKEGGVQLESRWKEVSQKDEMFEFSSDSEEEESGFLKQKNGKEKREMKVRFKLAEQRSSQEKVNLGQAYSNDKDE